jgi:hypothetical protein
MCMVSAGAFQAGQRGSQRVTPLAYLSNILDTTAGRLPFDVAMTSRSGAVGPVLACLG